MANLPCGFKSRHSHQRNKIAPQSGAILFRAMGFFAAYRRRQKPHCLHCFARIALKAIRFCYTPFRKTPQSIAGLLFSGNVTYARRALASYFLSLTVLAQKNIALLRRAYFWGLVLLTGLEPVRYRYRGILSPLRLPISPQQQNSILL